jgi:hypothetical protein
MDSSMLSYESTKEEVNENTSTIPSSLAEA